MSGMFNAGAAVENFVFLAVGGIAVGLAVSALWIFVVKRLREQTLIIMATTLMCWAAHLAGEALHVSGVIATVIAGLVLGWYQHVIFPARVRLRGSAFWHTLVFILEALVFIADGSFSERTMALSQPYPGTKSGYRGNVTETQEALDTWVLSMQRAGIQVNCHANGDVAIDAVLTALERAQQAHPVADHRPQITHCMLINDQLVKGSIAPGKYADYVVLAEDPHSADPAKIKDIRIVRTATAGRAVYEA